jgi:multiple sugar transport system permease protein/raffinose/stachyose/melibiose transport system permease protein
MMRNGKSFKTYIEPYLYLLPALLLLGLFLAYPIIYNLQVSLFDWNGVSPDKTWVRLGNYKNIFFKSGPFYNAMKNTFLFTFGAAIIQTAVGLVLAVLVSQVLFFRTVYRTIFFTPVIMSIVAVSFIWTWMYNPAFGIINSFLRAIGLERIAIAWLGNYNTALTAILVAAVWKWAGFTMVVYLAGIQNIPVELYEAASIEGAGRCKQFTNITFPLLLPQTFINVLLTTIGSLKVFDWVFIMTAGGPGRATEVLPYLIYSDAFRFHRIGYSAAEATVLFVIIIVLSYFIIRVFKGFEV